MVNAVSWGGHRYPSGSAPNVVVVLFDDLGFAQLGCYGSDIDTPTFDRLGAGGLRYNRFHVTALCSPSRASLLTGRNHHAVGMGFLADVPLDQPGYHGHRPKSAGTMPRILRDAGYATYAVGKWHLTPGGERSHVGPFDNWPLGWGFDKHYGFLRGDANHWAPALVRDNHYVEPPRAFDDGYHLTEDLADQAIRYVHDHQNSAPDKPFFLYFAPGAMHAPHHVSRAWVEPYRGRFDGGWEVARARTFERQVADGLVPDSAVLTDRPSWIPDWSRLSADERRLYTRMQETFAGFLTHTDHQVGRLVDHLDRSGALDNTIVVVLSDNGASAEGGQRGTWNEHRFTHRMPESVETSLQFVDDWGGHRTYSHYAWGWAWAGNTPFRLWKRYAWLGGTRSPLIVHWPDRVTDAGAARSQMSHIVDVMPTVLAACGVEAPTHIDGIEQQPVDGASLLTSFGDADAPNPRDVQYFEMLGSRSIIAGEWKATTDHVSRGVVDEEELLEGSRSFESDSWALFKLDEDFAESHDIAAQHPDKLDELTALWETEAERNGVVPMKDALQGEGAMILPPYPPLARRVFVPGGSPIPDEAVPPLFAGGRVSAEVDAPDDGGNGVLAAIGDWNAGFALYVRDGCPTAALTIGGEITIVAAAERLAPGRHIIGVGFDVEAGGTSVELTIGQGVVASGASPHPMPFIWQHGGSALTLGADSGFPVSDEYRPPFAWDGTLHEVVVESKSSAIPDPALAVRSGLASD